MVKLKVVYKPTGQVMVEGSRKDIAAYIRRTFPYQVNEKTPYDSIVYILQPQYELYRNDVNLSSK